MDWKLLNFDALGELYTVHPMWVVNGGPNVRQMADEYCGIGIRFRFIFFGGQILGVQG
jgi:hypothetical protein